MTIKVQFFWDGTMKAFDENGKSIPVLEKPWLSVWLNYALNNLHDPLEDMDINLPHGRKVKATKRTAELNLTEYEWEWEIIE